MVQTSALLKKLLYKNECSIVSFFKNSGSQRFCEATNDCFGTILDGKILFFLNFRDKSPKSFSKAEGLNH